MSHTKNAFQSCSDAKSSTARERARHHQADDPMVTPHWQHLLRGIMSLVHPTA